MTPRRICKTIGKVVDIYIPEREMMVAIYTAHGLAKVHRGLQFQNGRFEALSINFTFVHIFLFYQRNPDITR